jgi:hypothetical protein
MSVLSFPRIYFKGFMEWDPCTFNNDDWQAFLTYDPTNAALNWPFLATQAITPSNPQGITPDNFQTTFRPWAISLLDDTNPLDLPPNGPPGKRIPAEWNMFGGHGVSFTKDGNYPTTTIIGGDLGFGQSVTNDPLIGGLVTLSGDGGNGPGRLVDTNPSSFWSSQIYLNQLSFGGENCIISGPPNVRLHSRWLNLKRIYTQDQALTQPAAAVACCFQAGILSSQISWPSASANSPLAAALQAAASQSSAQGIMVRFTAYVNLYFKNGILNGIAQNPSSYEELAGYLATAWDTWNSSGGTDTSNFFKNPCYSHIVGVVGVWNEGEVATVPGGRYLSPVSPVAPLPQSDAKYTASPQHVSLGHHVMLAKTGDDAPPSTLLGPLVAHVDYDAQLISLDLNSTMPENGTPGEWPSDLSKTNFGPLTLGVWEAGAFAHIAEINYTQYGQTSSGQRPYEASAGIIDIPFPNPETGALLKNGTLALQVQGQFALMEQSYTAQTDSRGIYLDENEQAGFNITVCLKGVPSPDVNVLVAKYDEGLSLILTNNPTQLVNFTTGQQNLPVGNNEAAVAIVTSDENGIASVGIEAQNPGFPVLAFFPYTGNTIPQPPPLLLNPPANVFLITYAFYATVRVLPFDSAVPGNFVDVWNATGNPGQAWEFIYLNILYVYDMLFSVMLKYVNLGNQSAVEASIGSIWGMISEEAAQDSTLAMPITRDMSAGKRLALQLWIYLVANNYNVPNFNVNSIPAGWAPPG